MRILIALLCGVLFGVGLLVSGMAQPSKVQGFLDIAGLWDPSLALVMAGAIVVALPFFMLAKKRNVSILGCTMQLPSSTAIDKRLIIGSIIFGAGWGLAGICPGPAVATALLFNQQTLLFIVAMLVGLFAMRFFWHKAC